MAAPVAQARNWWEPALRGLLAVIFGLALLIWPGFALFTLRVLIVLFGVYALIDGLLALIDAVRAIQQHTQWWPRLLEGVLGITAAALVFFWTDVTLLLLLYVIAIWAAVTGISKMVSAFQRGEWLLGLSGLVSVVFGIVLVAFSGAEIGAIIAIIGVFAVVSGILLLGQALQLSARQ